MYTKLSTAVVEKFAGKYLHYHFKVVGLIFEDCTTSKHGSDVVMCLVIV